MVRSDAPLTYQEVYQQGKERLQKAQEDSCAFEAFELFKKVFRQEKAWFLLHKEDTAPKKETDTYFSLIDRRAKGYPLQYILGEWEFYSLPFWVGEGVLIPRADTETLIEVLLQLAEKEKAYQIVDLCSGSGCIACTAGTLLPKSIVTAVEWSESAFSYLQRNILRNELSNVTAVREDVFRYRGEVPFDFILSNPPYISDREMDSLQREVQYEPDMALRAGEDGFDFYRMLTKRYPCQLKKGGWMILEIGMGQEMLVKGWMEENGLKNVRFAKDLGGIVRVVYGQKG